MICSRACLNRIPKTCQEPGPLWPLASASAFHIRGRRENPALHHLRSQVNVSPCSCNGASLWALGVLRRSVIAIQLGDFVQGIESCPSTLLVRLVGVKLRGASRWEVWGGRRASAVMARCSRSAETVTLVVHWQAWPVRVGVGCRAWDAYGLVVSS